MNIKYIISTIDTHTAGEPARIIVDGFGKVKGETMVERMDYLRTNMDWLRKSLMLEPRGHRDMFGCILLPPIDPSADAATIFFDTGKYYSMCGHASLAICTMMVETGRLRATSGKTFVRLETPAGMVKGTVNTDETGKITKVSLVDVPYFAWALDKQIELPDYGKITVDIGVGGDIFVIVSAEQLGIESIDPIYTNELIKIGIKVREAANSQISVQHPIYEHIDTIECCMITAPPSGPHADGRNILILGDGQADRSPCGTGTCARMAVMHRKGQLAVGQLFRHESSIRSVFEGKIISETTVGDIPAIIPEISCRPFLTGFHRFLIHPEDPFAEGFIL